MIDIQITRKGWDEAINRLSLVEAAFKGDVILEDLQVIAERTLELARDLVPFDTGALRDSLQIFVDTKSLTVTVGTDGGIRPDGQRRIYGRYVELGTSKMSAQPFLVPALFQAISEFRERFPQKIREVGRIGIR